ncbi:hypothetical protein [Methylobacterium haplocladii]|uniref:Uncharacterized protein n=1 Tax=Methylobacterium haplocladii TaxID=1176176 RepID=A0A512ITM1_9HYPH|nr:hypothetical protein [Methylobacterium haplocladii]GEP01055.1 hypothetical protein MHA02_34420 [Methylobacterium haplocladii]GJD85640.1 hypothetical protein HPGCJGGD_3530 [Methylobacterium haplocladii]GLS60507.1 hypothetical protein GCM10007887_31860 [Methylobacterium haplocladii]
MILRAAAAGLALCLAAGTPARADGCDALTARLIRGTGASFAGRTGPLVVFRATDAERMSLDCGTPHRMIFRSREREPNRFYFVLIGLAATTLAGADAERVEVLALNLHQQTLLTGEPQQGRLGGVVLRCEPTDRLDGFSDGALCRLAADRRPRRRGGLSARS